VILGIVLLVLSVLGSIALAGVLAGASSDGTLALAGLGTVSPSGAVVVAAVAAMTITAGFFLGVHLVLQQRRRRGQVVLEDRLARDAEREARARLLEMRLEQLEGEVAILEGRRKAVIHRSSSGVGASWRVSHEPEVELVVVPESDEPASSAS
jgi:hypothetical protein